MKIEVKGLSQALANLKTLGSKTEGEVVNKSLREACWALAKPMREATYTTFQKQTGAIKSGLSVAVLKHFAHDQMKAYVVEYPQKLVAGNTPTAALFRKHLTLKGYRPKAAPGTEREGARVDLQATAYWWRFLEQGTKPRHRMSTPSFIKKGRPISSNPKYANRQRTRLSEWLASPSRGGISGRSWLKPIAASMTPQAIDLVRKTALAENERIINEMSKQ